jgi:hypothetical protein
VGPGQYDTSKNFDLSMDTKNQAETLYPGQKREQAFSQEIRWKKDKNDANYS